MKVCYYFEQLLVVEQVWQMGLGWPQRLAEKLRRL